MLLEDNIQYIDALEALLHTVQLRSPQVCIGGEPAHFDCTVCHLIINLRCVIHGRHHAIVPAVGNEHLDVQPRSLMRMSLHTNRLLVCALAQTMHVNEHKGMLMPMLRSHVASS